MHDELMSSMDISQKMLELTACAILPITSDNKLIDININNRLISIDNNINNEINDTNDSNSNQIIEGSSDECLNNDENSEQSIKELVNEYINEVINEEEKHFCDHLTNDSNDKKFSVNNNKSLNAIIFENGKFNEEEVRSVDELEEEPNNSLNDVKFVENDSVIVLENGLKVINGCVEPPFDPPIDKPLRFTNQLQFLKQMMTKYLCRYKTALPFLKPVDCMKLKIPDYYKVIDNPMDLTTIKKRLTFLWYSSANECLNDFKLIFDNCFKFNCAEDYVYKAGKKLEEYLNEKLQDMPSEELELPLPPKPNIVDIEKKVVKRKAESTTDESHDLIIAESIEGLTRQRNGKKMLTRREHGLQVKKPNKDLPTPIASPPLAPPKRVPLNTSMKYCLDFVKEMLSKKHIEYAWPFYEPVSTQLYPDYLTIIKKPMDLSTIKNKIETGQYKYVKSFVEDMRLMFTNCLRYNKPEAPVIDQARKLREFFEFRYSKMPEELLNEKMSTNNTNNNSNNSFAEKQMNSKIEVTDNSLKANELENQQRMQILENQVKILTNAMSTLAGVKTKQLKNTIGVKKQKSVNQSSSKKRKKTSNNANKTSPPKQHKVRKESPQKKKKTNYVVDEDDDKSNMSLVPSPIAFQYNDMEDLKQLKTDLENLDAKDLKSVLRILQTTEPSIKCDNDENIEIDFEILKPETLIALRKFVSSCMLNNIPKKNKSSVNGSESSKKQEKSLNCDNNIPNISPLFPSSSRLSESSSDSDSNSESSSDSDSSDNDED